MDTFGERLKHEREERGLTMEAVAEAVGLDRSGQLALESNNFAALPNEAVMMDCLDRYAELLDVDAELMIADYGQEREKYVKERASAPVRKSAVAAATRGSAEKRARKGRSPLPIVLVVLAIVVLAAFWLLSRRTDEAVREAPVAAVEVTPASGEPSPGLTGSGGDEVPPGSSEPAPTRAEEPETQVEDPAGSTADSGAEATPMSPESARAAASSLRIRDYGVGTGVDDRRLVGQSDRFEEGTAVAFWTRVEGGAAGDWIDHVWYLEGQIVARRKMEIGGPNWRTFTVKTIDGGVGSVWVAEARDSTGRVLARSEFISSP
jgi:cytoskeletal protein RodZ